MMWLRKPMSGSGIMFANVVDPAQPEIWLTDGNRPSAREMR
jgi:hypothetical protein